MSSPSIGITGERTDESARLSPSKERNVYIASQLRELADLMVSASTKRRSKVKVCDGSSLLEPLSDDGATSASKLHGPVDPTSAPIDDSAKISVHRRTSTVKEDDPKFDYMSEGARKSHVTLQVKRLLQLLHTRTAAVVNAPGSSSLEDTPLSHNPVETPQTDVTLALELPPSSPFFGEGSKGGYIGPDQAELVAVPPPHVNVEPGTETQRNMEPRRDCAIRRADIWRRMLEASTQRASALLAMEQENTAVLNQGVILPCAPSNEEKVNATAPTASDVRH